MKTIKIGDTCTFTKSGSVVRVMGPFEPYMGQDTFIVENVDSGKQNIVVARSLVPITNTKR